MRNLVSSLREVVQIPIEVHCHNDFGLAVANSIASVQGGASGVEVIVNGMDPERSGVAALEELVVALELLYGCHMGVDLEGLVDLSRLHQAMTNTTVAANKPVVGARAFNYRVAPGQKGSEPKRDQFYSSPTANPFDPRLVGNTRAFLVGKFSGPNEVSERLGHLGLSCTDSELRVLTALVSQRGRSLKRAVTDDEFHYLYRVAQLVSGHPSSGVEPDDSVSVIDARHASVEDTG
jgi:isopropylmalate/homocitrate/citramalate synthase